MEQLKEALKAYQKFNRLRNDTDAYLFALAEWALSGEPKPNPEDYGVPATEQTDTADLKRRR